VCDPELAELRELNENLRNNKISAAEAKKANVLAEIMRTNDVDGSRLHPALKFYEDSRFDVRVDGLIEVGLCMIKLEEEHKVSYDDLLA